MMTSLLERYRGGQFEEVWAELLTLGPAVREEPVLFDALAVARETMARARQNLEQMASRLSQIGYEFERPGYMVVPIGPPDADLRERITGVERIAGVMPLSLRAWYEVVGGVSLLGAHPAWPGSEDTDPLVVYPLRFAPHDFEDWQAWCAEDGLEAAGPYCVSIAPDAWHNRATRCGGRRRGAERMARNHFCQLSPNLLSLGRIPGHGTTHPTSDRASALRYEGSPSALTTSPTVRPLSHPIPVVTGSRILRGAGPRAISLAAVDRTYLGRQR